MYYNDANPEKIFFQGLALLKLAEAADSDQEREQLQGQANGRFYKLLNYGKQHLFEHQTMDYFAVSLPDLLIWDDSLDRKNELHCKRMIELGNQGLSESAALKNK